MNSIRVLLNAVKGINIKVGITMNNGITYRCYVVDNLDTSRFRVCNKFEGYISPNDNDENDNKKYNTIDVNYVGRVVIRANH
jgi:hypothetical protein